MLDSLGFRMIHATETQQPDQTPPAPITDPGGDSVDVGRLLRVVWEFRRVILLGSIAVMAAYLAYTAVLFVISPVTQTATLAFRLQFERDEYPNQAPFKPDDIMAIPVLEEVFAKNEFGRFGDFATFRSGFLVTKSSSRLEMLASAFRARLTEARLTAADRARIADEFESQREALLTEPDYVLSFTRQSRRSEVPRALLNKVLADVLLTWAQQAEERKGVLRSRVVTFSAGALRSDFAKAEEPLIAADVLRVHAQRLLGSIQTLRDVPGAAATRTRERQLLLADVHARVEDTVGLLVAPVAAQLAAAQVVQSRGAVVSYYDARLAGLRIQRDESAARATSYERSLLEFSRSGFRAGEDRAARAPGTAQDATPPANAAEDATAAPAGSGGFAAFFESVFRLATLKEDAVFRRNLVERLTSESRTLASLQAETTYYERLGQELRAGTGAAAAPPRLKALLDEALVALEGATQDLSAVYAEVAAQHLRGPTLLYALTEPLVVTRTSATTGGRPFLTALALGAVSLLLLPVLCLGYHVLQARDPNDGGAR